MLLSFGQRMRQAKLMSLTSPGLASNDHSRTPRRPGQIRSVLNVQEMTARALLIDTAALDTARLEGDVLTANRVYMDAFYTDVRPDLATWRESRGLPGDPEAAYAASGYQEQIEAERVGGTQAGWN